MACHYYDTLHITNIYLIELHINIKYVNLWK